MELDRPAFRALSSDTRINMLKALNERRKTVTELAKSLNLSKSAAYEHLTLLTEVELVRKIETENKWVYYELTDKGLGLLRNNLKKVIFILSSAMITLAAGSYEVVRYIVGEPFTIRYFIEPLPAEAVKMVVHEPTHLIFGFTLIIAGVFIMYFSRRLKNLLFGFTRTFSEA